MIGRRGFVGGVLAMIGRGGNPPMRADQIANLPQTRAGSGPAPASPFVVAQRVIVFGTGSARGIFVYSPTPGAGNLVASIAASSGTDPYGNAYQAGVTSYAAPATNSFAKLGTGAVLQIAQAGTTILSIATNSPAPGVELSATSNLLLVPNTSAGGGSVLVAAAGGVSPATTALFEVDGAAAVRATGANILSVTERGGAPAAPPTQFIANAAGDRVLGIEVTGDTAFRYRVDSNGRTDIGNGTVTDVHTLRAAAGVYAINGTPGNLVIGADTETTTATLEVQGVQAFLTHAAPATPPASFGFNYWNTDGTMRAKGTSGADVMLYGNDGLNLMSALGFQNGWVAGARVLPQYRHWYGNEIELIGSFVVPVGFVAGQTIVTLPVGYRPANTQSFWGADIGNNNAIRFNLGTAGGLNFGGPAASTGAGNTIDFHGYISLDA